MTKKHFPASGPISNTNPNEADVIIVKSDIFDGFIQSYAPGEHRPAWIQDQRWVMTQGYDKRKHLSCADFIYSTYEQGHALRQHILNIDPDAVLSVAAILHKENHILGYTEKSQRPDAITEQQAQRLFLAARDGKDPHALISGWEEKQKRGLRRDPLTNTWQPIW